MTMKRISFLELTGLTVLSWLFLWHWGPEITSYSTTLMAAGYLFILTYISYISPVLIHGDDHRYRGLSNWKTLFIRTDNFLPALYPFSIITLIGAILIIFASLLKNPSIFHQLNWNVFFLKLCFYILSSAVQGLFTLFILMRLIDLSTSDPFQINSDIPSEFKSRLLLTAMITCFFCLIHIPNFPVMGIILTSTPIVLWQYFKTPNFFLLICTHAILGTLLHRIYELPMRIGPFYSNPDRYLIRELFPIIGRIIGNSW